MAPDILPMVFSVRMPPEGSRCACGQPAEYSILFAARAFGLLLRETTVPLCREHMRALAHTLEVCAGPVVRREVQHG